MSTVVEQLDQIFNGSDDYVVIYHVIGKCELRIAGLNSLVDLPKSLNLLEEQVKGQAYEGERDKRNGKQEVSDYLQSLLEGKLIVSSKEGQHPWVFNESVGLSLSRPIEGPTNDNILQGPLSAFTEDLSLNLGLTRKEVVSSSLTVKSFEMGTGQKRNVSLLFRSDKVKQSLVEKVIRILEENSRTEVSTIQDILNLCNGSKKHLISYFYKTELLQEVNKSLLGGKVVLFMDRYPFALILPNGLADMFFLENDRNYTYPLMLVMRFIRIIGVLLALILPGLYIALVSVNPEMLRVELALTVAQSREGVPYPAFVEVILLLVVLELILEANVRLPKSIGPTITMVGGIIIGQAAVDARLVSNLLIIVLAATTIASSSIVGIQNSLVIRVFKYIVMVLSAIFGVLGLFTGLFVVASYVASLTIFGVPYFTIKGVERDG